MSESVAAADDKPSVLPRLAAGTLVAAVAACFVAQLGVSIPATTQGYINQDLHISSTTLTWVSDAFMVPVTLLELSFGVRRRPVRPQAAARDRRGADGARRPARVPDAREATAPACC